MSGRRPRGHGDHGRRDTKREHRAESATRTRHAGRLIVTSTVEDFFPVARMIR
jgi:hypothetical protein